VGVDGESSADFFRQISSPVVTRGKFEVHTSPFAVARFVFDPNVGNWNLSSNNLKPMPFGNEMFLLGRRLARTELGEIVVEALLHLVVENDAEISASLLLDPLRGLLIEAIEIGIVVGFAGFSESVVENLTFAGALRVGEETMAVLGEGEQLARTHFLMGNGLYFDQALTHKIFDIRPHAPFVPP